MLDAQPVRKAVALAARASTSTIWSAADFGITARFEVGLGTVRRTAIPQTKAPADTTSSGDVLPGRTISEP